MKTKEQIISITEAQVGAYTNEPLWGKKNIEKYMQEFSNQQNKGLKEELKNAKEMIEQFIIFVKSTDQEQHRQKQIDNAERNLTH